MKYLLSLFAAFSLFASPVPVYVNSSNGDVSAPEGETLNLPAGTTLDSVPIATGTGAEITVKDDGSLTSTNVSTLDLGPGLEADLSGSEVNVLINIDEASGATPTLVDTILFADQDDSGLVKKATLTDLKTLVGSGSAEIIIKEDDAVTSTKVTTLDVGEGLTFTYSDPEVDLDLHFSEFGTATPTLADSFVLTDASDSDNEKKATLAQLQSLIDTTYTAGDALDLTGTVFSLDHLGIEDLADPDADRVPFWDDSDGATQWLTIGAHFSLSGDVLVITTDAVDNTLLSNMAESTLKGRADGAGTGDPQDLTPAQVRTLLNIEDNSTADQSDAEIETAYNNQVAQVSSAERTAGVELAIRRFSPEDIKSMIDTHAGVGGGGSGTMNRVKDNGSQVGDADIITLDLGPGFDVSEALDTEIDINMHMYEFSSSPGTLDLTDEFVFLDDDNSNDERKAQLSDLQTLIDTDTDTQLTAEQVEDFVGGMVAGNTETGITVTYQDADGTLDFVVTGGGGGDDWGDPVDADIVPDADGTRDLGATGTRFAEVYADALDVTNNITVGGTVDGRDLATDGTKLDGIEASATADQSDAEIETAYNNQVEVVGQAEAEAGVATTVRRWTAERVAQAIAALETDTDTQLTQEQVEDFAGGMDQGTETRVTFTYNDGTGNFDIVVDDMNDDQPDDDSEVPDAITVSGGTVTNSDVTLKQSTTPTPTAEGRAEWDTDDNVLAVGDGSATQTFSPDAALDTEAELEARLADVADVYTSNDGSLGDQWGDVVDADIVPDADGTRDLGATGTRFAETYTDALDVTDNITVGGTVDGRDVAADGTKLDGVEASATADQSDAEIETAYHNQVSLVSQAEAEAGVATTTRQWTALRVAQAIAALETDTDTQLTEEQVEDFVGGMVAGNTETGITVTYQDADGTLDFVVDLSSAVADADFDANTILAANTDNTPAALTVGTDTILGRASGNIDDLGPIDARAVLDVEQGIISATIIDPGSVHGVDPDVLLRMETTVAITVTEVIATCDADPTTELDWDLFFADAFIGKANQTKIDTIDTTNGTTDITSGFDDATVPAGKAIYITFGAAPDAAITQVSLQIKYTVD